jgi:hypothetical protein
VAGCGVSGEKRRIIQSSNLIIPAIPKEIKNVKKYTCAEKTIDSPMLYLPFYLVTGHLSSQFPAYTNDKNGYDYNKNYSHQ